MKIKVTNLYNDITPTNSEFKSNHGQAFLIDTPDIKLLFDTGKSGKIFLHNMTKLAINPDDIGVIVLSHGHNDHTGGLFNLLKARTIKKQILLIAHPDIFLPKGKFQSEKKTTIKNIGFSKIPEKSKNILNFHLTKEPFEITPYVISLGEINNRPFKEGISKSFVYNLNGKWLPDKIIDDLSLIIKTKNGLVLLCGCCHAGLLNTLLKVESLFPGIKINSIIGGTHMFQFSVEEVDFVARRLKEKYFSPKLFLNHCTGNNTMDQLSEIYNNILVERCLIGNSLTFEC